MDSAEGRAGSLGVVLVSGGSSGLGAAVARAVGTAGGTPVVLDRREPLEPWDAEVVDLADTAEAHRAVERAARRHGRLDAVVTCAGIDVPGSFETVPAVMWERVVAVNLLATAAVARAALGHLERSHGRLVTVASTLGHTAAADASAYCASKFGVVGFSRALMAELKGRVGVTLLIPGGMRTSFFDDREDRYKPAADALLCDPDHVAHAVLTALCQPPGVEIKEMVIAAETEVSWP